MLTLNLFITGMEKSGTTSLADWLVSNQIARYLVPGIKEPYASAENGTPPPPPGEIALDASTGYALTPPAIEKMPEHGSKDLVSLGKLDDLALRKAFVEELVGSAPEALSALPALNMARSSSVDEFSKPELSNLQHHFRSDFEYFKELLVQHGLPTRYLDLDELNPESSPE